MTSKGGFQHSVCADVMQRGLTQTPPHHLTHAPRGADGDDRTIADTRYVGHRCPPPPSSCVPNRSPYGQLGCPVRVRRRAAAVKGPGGATKGSATGEGATTGTLAAPHRATRTGEARGTAKSGPYRRWTRASPPEIAARRPHRHPHAGNHAAPHRSVPYRAEPPSRRPRRQGGAAGTSRGQEGHSRRDAQAPLTARGGGHTGGTGRRDTARRGRTAGASSGALGRGACPRSRCQFSKRQPARGTAAPVVRADRGERHGEGQARRAPPRGGGAGCAARAGGAARTPTAERRWRAGGETVAERAHRPENRRGQRTAELQRR